jgi:anti-sigma regulatory factor (Ser/Thr protein kinase)
MTKAHTLELSNDIAELNILHDFMDRLGSEWSLSAKVQHGITLAVEELITNKIKYGYDTPGVHHIHCSFILGDNAITITIRDDGNPFDPFAYPVPDTNAPLAERSIGGLGIYLVRMLMDASQYERLENENKITLRKIIG